MRGSTNQQGFWRKTFLGAGLLVAVGLTGCQIDEGGQTLPSPNYLNDDVQYFPPGPQMKLSREAAAMKEYSEQQPRGIQP